ncbi:MAG: 1-deoxy-D-xylulose-5-phosphate reductoisomerase [Coriobacteriaceae bacterium]|nr:1-deoxy-D-xylulose-5-phosphate reductoisomerase [Coriobacteriaceae bacterium]
MSVIRLVILGSTGSIGRQALDVAASHPDRIEVVALAAGKHGYALGEQAVAFGVKRLAAASSDAADEARGMVAGATVGAGAAAVEELAALPEADVVLNALVGSAGLRATIRALESGKRLALANKESLVVGGELVTRLVQAPDRLVPVDSEHSAIFQCMVGERTDDVERIWLTASGGPFRGMSRAELDEVPVSQALRHPRWNMGPKITIDSATLMNKGLEAIEAHHLFGLPYERIRTLVHPQSCVHSMVEFRDGSFKAHLGATDMRIPIQYALSYPERWAAPLPPVDFAEIGRLDFEEPDLEVFRCLALALEAGRVGGTMPAAMNAANEVAVAAYLEHRCRLTDIDRVVESVLAQHTAEPLSSVEQVEAVDAWARAVAERILAA